MAYQPPFTLTDRMLDRVAAFSVGLGAWLGKGDSALASMLRRENRFRAIQASLEIEQNTLTLEQVGAVIEGETVSGPLPEIQEVKNAFTAYEELEQWTPSSEPDLLEAHGLMMAELVDGSGRYRSGGVGVFNGGELIHAAPPAKLVPRLMGDLLDWLERTDLHPLVAASLFHFEFEFIHPFADGNGRMGRLWQTLILSKWHPELAWLPVETVIRDRRQAYYDVLAQADEQAEGTVFVEFMLDVIADTLERELDQNGGVSDGVNVDD